MTPRSPLLRAGMAAWLLSLAVPMALAQTASSMGATSAPNASVTGRVTEAVAAASAGASDAPIIVKALTHSTTASEPAKTEDLPAPTSTPTSTPAPAPAQPLPEASTTPVSTPSGITSIRNMDWEGWWSTIDPKATALLSLAILLALLSMWAFWIYRRNQRADDLTVSSAQWTEEEPFVAEEPQGPLPATQGLQPDIMALDLELASFTAPAAPAAPAPVDPVAPAAPAAPAAHPLASLASAPPLQQPSSPSAVPPKPASTENLTLSKLEWAQKLLAAGENDLARVILASVADSLESQLKLLNSSIKGPNQ